MKNAIRLKIEAALESHQRELKRRISVAEQIEQETPKLPPPRYNLRLVESEVHAAEKFWKVAEIAKRHAVSETLVRQQLKGKPGWLQFGRSVRITDSLYRDWIRNAITRNLN